MKLISSGVLASQLMQVEFTLEPLPHPIAYLHKRLYVYKLGKNSVSGEDQGK